MSLYMRYLNAMAATPAPGRGCHPYLLKVANLGIRAGVKPNQICRDIRKTIPTGSRKVPNREIQQAVEKAAREAGKPLPARFALPANNNIVDGSKLFGAITEQVPKNASLEKLSPVELPYYPTDDGILLLRKLYQPDEYIFLGDRYDKQVKTVDIWIEELKSGRNWPHIMPNPLSGKQALTQDGKPSYRCDAAINNFRYTVVEFDDTPLVEQERFWVGVISKELLDVATVIDSGGKSLHGWIRTDCQNRNEWDRKVKAELFNRWMVPMGADRACSNPGRLSRLPGHPRDDDNMQALLYLNPGV